MTNLTVSPLKAKPPRGFKQPVCQTGDCQLPAVWLVRGPGVPAVTCCELHLSHTIAVLSDLSEPS